MGTEILVPDIRSRRLAAGLSQRDLAQRADCSWPTIRLFDRGYIPTRSEVLPRVLAVLDATEAELLKAGAIECRSDEAA